MKYILDKLSEKSTWLGLLTLAGFAGIKVAAPVQAALIDHLLPLITLVSGALIAHDEKK